MCRVQQHTRENKIWALLVQGPDFVWNKKSIKRNRLDSLWPLSIWMFLCKEIRVVTRDVWCVRTTDDPLVISMTCGTQGLPITRPHSQYKMVHPSCWFGWSSAYWMDWEPQRTWSASQINIIELIDQLKFAQGTVLESTFSYWVSYRSSRITRTTQWFKLEHLLVFLFKLYWQYILHNTQRLFFGIS